MQPLEAAMRSYHLTATTFLCQILPLTSVTSIALKKITSYQSLMTFCMNSNIHICQRAKIDQIKSQMAGKQEENFKNIVFDKKSRKQAKRHIESEVQTHIR